METTEERLNQLKKVVRNINSELGELAEIVRNINNVCISEFTKLEEENKKLKEEIIELRERINEHEFKFYELQDDIKDLKYNLRKC